MKRVFACHYESKYFSKSSNFVGAMDSAVPCAFLLSAASYLHEIERTFSLETNDLTHNESACEPGSTAQLIFFDGEEAIKSWTTGDKLYGSTALAEKWDAEGILKDIELFVLLDLLGKC